MKSWLLWSFAAGLTASGAGAAGFSPERMKAASETAFLAAPGAAGNLMLSLSAPGFSGAGQPPPARGTLLSPTGTAALCRQGDGQPVLQDPGLTPTGPSGLGGEVGRVQLSELLDRHRDLLVRQLGGSVWAIGAAGDPGFKNYFLTFLQAAKLVIGPLGDLNRLRGDGIDFQVDGKTVYNFRVSISIFNPVRGSTLHITPTAATSGPRHDVKTGVILDAVKAKSYVFKADSKEFWLLHGTDVDPKTNQLADTRSFLFIHEAGMDTKAWPVAESALEVGKPATVTLGGTKLALTRTAEGVLLINSAL